MKHLRRFGCLAYVKLHKHGKFEPESVAGMFIGYAPNWKAYRVAVGGKWVLGSPSVVFDESRHGIDVLRSRDVIPAELLPQPLGGLEPLAGHEEAVNLDQGESDTLQWVNEDALRPVVRPAQTGEFIDVERRFSSGPPSFPLGEMREVVSHPLILEEDEDFGGTDSHYKDRLRKAILLQSHPVAFPQGRRKQGKQSTLKDRDPTLRGEGEGQAPEIQGDGQASERARLLADHLRRVARGQGEAARSGVNAGIRLPLERGPVDPAEVPLDVPAPRDCGSDLIGMFLVLTLARDRRW